MFIRIACFIVLFFVLFNACIKDDGTTFRTISVEQEELASYIKKEKITAKPTSLGVYNISQTEGTGAQLCFGDTVTVKYKSYLLNGTQFADSTETFILGEHDDGLTDFKIVGGTQYANNDDAIPGMDNGIWKMKAGGKARLIIPSSKAYGTTATTKVPAYSTILCDVEITKVRTGIHPDNYEAPYRDSTYTALGSPIFFKERVADSIAKLVIGKKVTIRYSAYLSDGYLFYSSVIVNGVVKGSLEYIYWTEGLLEGLLMMRKGEKARLILPYDKNEPVAQGYGAKGLDPYVPPCTTIYFDIEVIAVN